MGVVLQANLWTANTADMAVLMHTGSATQNYEVQWSLCVTTPRDPLNLLFGTGVPLYNETPLILLIHEANPCRSSSMAILVEPS